MGYPETSTRMFTWESTYNSRKTSGKNQKNDLNDDQEHQCFGICGNLLVHLNITLLLLLMKEMFLRDNRKCNWHRADKFAPSLNHTQKKIFNPIQILLCVVINYSVIRP